MYQKWVIKICSDIYLLISISRVSCKYVSRVRCNIYRYKYIARIEINEKVLRGN